MQPYSYILANQAVFEAIMSKTDDPYVLNLVQSSIEALKQKPTIASASYTKILQYSSSYINK